MQITNAVPGERRAAQLVTQLSALAAAVAVLVAFIVIDARVSANASNATGTAAFGPGTTSNYKATFNDQMSSLAVGGTTSIGANVPRKYTAQLAAKLTRIKRHAPTTTTTKAT